MNRVKMRDAKPPHNRISLPETKFLKKINTFIYIIIISYNVIRKITSTN